MFLKGIVLLSVTILIVVIVLHEKNNCLIVANITKIFLNLAVAYRNLFQEKTTQSSFLHKEDLPMAETKKLYTLADILGEPITEQEAQNLIRKETNSDEQTFQNYVNLNETYRNKLLHFIMGKNGLSTLMTQFSDMSCFREETPNGWNIFFQSFLTSQYTLNKFFHAKAARLSKMAALSLQILLHPWKMAPLSTLRFRKSGTHSPGNGAAATLLT